MSTISTKLDIINSCMQSIGENPVTDVDSEHPSAISARAIMLRQDKAIQMRGWWYNREFNLKLLPNTAGEVILPSNTLKCDPVNPSSPYVKRGNKLYDPVQHTYNINAPVYVYLIVQLDIEDLPASAADFLMKDATEKFYTNEDGDPDKAKKLQQDALRASVELMKEELSASDVNSRNRQVHRQLRSRLIMPGDGGFSASGDPDLTVPGGF